MLSNELPHVGAAHMIGRAWSSAGVISAERLHEQHEAEPAAGGRKKLTSGLSLVDRFLAGGLPRGALVEWGAPLGMGGREVLLLWLAQLGRDRDAWALWASGRSELEVYPPAWRARGVCLERVRFARTPRPLSELRAVFLEPFFQLIVLDGVALSSMDECAFLARQARLHRQLIVLVRDGLLEARRSNVWARLRVNCRFEARRQCFRLEIVRGLAPRSLALPIADFIKERAALVASSA